MAAHVYLLKQDAPDTLIKDLLEKEYPTLVAHANTVYAKAFPEPFNFTAVVSSQTSFTLRSLFPPSTPTHAGPKSAAVDEQERKFALMRRAFFGGAFLVVGAYTYHQRGAFVDVYNYYRLQLLLAIIAAQRGEDDEDDDEDEEDGEDGVDSDEEVD